MCVAATEAERERERETERDREGERGGEQDIGGEGGRERVNNAYIHTDAGE